MKSIQIAACDDDREILGVISGAVKSALSQRGFSSQVQVFSEGQSLVDAVRTQKNIQLVLLDIDMPKMDGITAGKKIRQIAPELPIVYVSECEGRVFDAFQTGPLCFVRKSHFLTDISTAMDLFLKSYQRLERYYVELTARNGLIRINCQEIVYIEGQRNYQQLHLAGCEEVEELKMTMDRLEELLCDQGFIRVHKGYLVNHSFIQRINGPQLQLRNGEFLPIGRSKLEEVKRKYIQMM